jgi:hypothetical protein
MSSIKITMINNNDIKNDLNIILYIKKNNININYSIFYNDTPIQTKTIEQHNILDYEKYIVDSSIVIDMNPTQDDYKNLLYCITHNIPIIINKQFIRIDCNEMLFTDIDDVLNIIDNTEIVNYIQFILEYNNKKRDNILLEYKIDTKKNINYNIKKKVNNNNILNLYSCLVDLDENYRLCDYIECIKKNVELDYLNTFYLFKKKDYNIEYIPNNILDNNKICIIIVNNYNIETLFHLINNNGKNINCILNLDIYINNTDIYTDYISDIIKNPKNVYCLSRIETDTKKCWEHPKLKNLYYSLTQDMWLFNGTIDITHINKNIVLGNVWNDIIFNHYLVTHNYNIINNSQSTPILHLDTYIMINKNYMDPIRIINEDVNISNEEYHLLPDKKSISGCSVDALINKLTIKEDDIYDIKKYIMNKYIKIN